MTHDWYSDQRPPAYSNFKKISTAEDWFKVYGISPDLFAFYEPRHYEGTIVNLAIGKERAALIDTGCRFNILFRLTWIT